MTEQCTEFDDITRFAASPFLTLHCLLLPILLSILLLAIYQLTYQHQIGSQLKYATLTQLSVATLTSFSRLMSVGPSPALDWSSSTVYCIFDVYTLFLLPVFFHISFFVLLFSRLLTSFKDTMWGLSLCKRRTIMAAMAWSGKN